jgi:hypothetical protein
MRSAVPLLRESPAEGGGLSAQRDGAESSEIHAGRDEHGSASLAGGGFERVGDGASTSKRSRITRT